MRVLTFHQSPYQAQTSLGSQPQRLPSLNCYLLESRSSCTGFELDHLARSNLQSTNYVSAPGGFCQIRLCHTLLLRMSAHSLSVAWPISKAPAERNFDTTCASRGTIEPTSIQLPAVVSILSLVAMLSLTRNGIPCSGPRTWPAARSASRAAAIEAASGLSCSTPLHFLSDSLSVHGRYGHT